MSFEYFIGRRYLRAKQKQAFISLISFLSVAGVTVGVMALIIVIAVMAGFESDLKSRILGVESHVILLHHGGPLTNYEQVLPQIEETTGVAGAAPFIYSQVMLRSAAGVSGAVLRGIVPDQENRINTNIKADALEPAAVAPGDGKQAQQVQGIVLGKELARNLGLTLGDPVYVISPRGMLSPVGHLPAMRRFQLTGFFQSGMYEYDGSLAYVRLEEAQRMLRMGDAVTGIEVRVNDIYKARAVAQQLVKKLGFPFWARDWMQMNHNLFSALKLEKIVMFIILTLIVLVAAFNIASSLIMMVMEKTKDIAILKAMGATDRSIRKIFVFKGMVIGAIGTTLGVIFGYVLCKLLEKYKFIELPKDVYYISTLPVRLEALDALAIASAAMLICFLATLYPAKQAARLDPIEALRYG